MIPEFLSLTEKVGQLADLAHALRRENAELRMRCASLIEENALLAQRMQQAHDRVAQLLESLPESQTGRQQEAA